ncbi:MAG: inositol 2-dehydrogenase [Pseudomonadota bacterium]
MRVAVLGTGRIGKMHAENIVKHDRTALAAVFDINRESADALAQQFGVTSAASPQEIFAADDVDAILVATATHTHADFIEQSVAAGKPVLCEKPIDLSLERVNACAQKVKGAGVPIQIGFNRRFDPGHKAARDAAHGGEIGALHQVLITSRDPEMPPRSYYETAGGIMRDMTIHDFDLARYMLGESPVEVFATASRLIDPAMMSEIDDHDTVMIIMTCADGKQCHINNSRTATYGYDQRVELMGSTGMLISDNVSPTQVRRYGKKNANASEPYLYFFIERYEAAFAAEIDAFVDAVAAGTEPSPSFEDGRQALILAEAAYRSLAEKRAVRVEEIA